MNLLISPWLAQAEDGLGSFVTRLTGPQFLGWYALWFVLVFGVVLVLRWREVNTPALTLIGLLGYEIPGFLRIYVFSEPGMHKWAFLIAMMVFGGLAFLSRSENPDGSGRRWWSNNCSSTSSSSCSGHPFE